MTHRALALTSYNFKPDDKLLLDANIWLFIYGPRSPGDTKVEVYSDAFNKILTAQCRIYIDVLIVSEFINTYARLKWNLWKKDSGSPIEFKQFRKSERFKSIAQDIAADVKRILKHCLRMDNGFGSLAIDALINDYASGNFDFNDQILANLCKNNGLKLVTDDSDFKNHEIFIITANKWLLV